MEKEEEMFLAAKKVGETHMTELGDGMGKLADNMLNKAMLPKDALGIGDQNMEKLYAEAYRLYNNGKYTEAQNMFSTLIMLNTMDPRYLFGLAACFHMRKDYENAANNYIRSALLDVQNPIPYYHASDCYMQMQDNLSAITALKLVIKRSGEKPEFSVIKDRCKLTLEKLTKEKDSALNEEKAAAEETKAG